MKSLGSEFNISIIVPLFNKQDYIVDCLNSLVSQTFKSFEVIVVDDGSMDGSAELVKRYVANNVRLIQQANQGLGAARNTGINKARGEFLLFVDSDDEVLPDCLEKIYAVAVSKKADITEFNYALINSKNQPLWQTNRRMPSNFVSAVTCKSDSSACNRLFKRSLFMQNHVAFLTDVYYEDIATIYKLYFYSQQNASLDEVLYLYHAREDSITSSTRVKHVNDLYKVLQSTQNFLNDNNIADKEDLFRLRLLRCSVMMAKKLIESKPFDESLFSEFIKKFKAYKYIDNHETFLVNRNELELVTDFRKYLTYSDWSFGKSKQEVIIQMAGMPFMDENSSLRSISYKETAVSLDFSRKLNRLVEQISLITLRYKKIVVYGDGLIGKLAADILGRHAVLVVDKTPDEHSGSVRPEMIKQCDFEFVLICVLGREEPIKSYLIEDLKISADKVGCIVF
jgi:glycosyltransferase involved in cell wall biosynthesis